VCVCVRVCVRACVSATTHGPPPTHDLLLVEIAGAVGGGQGGGAGLAVPGHVAVLRGAADGQRVDAVRVAVAVAAVLLPAAVPRGPHKDGAQPSAALRQITKRGGVGRRVGRQTVPPPERSESAPKL